MLDHSLTTNDLLNFRYSFSQGSQLDPLSTAGANVPGFPVGRKSAFAELHRTRDPHFFASLVGVARFSFLRNKFLFDEHINHTTPESLGFQYEPSLDVAIGPPFIQVSGYASIGDPITGPRNTFQNSFDFSGSLTWVKGRHQMKFGVGYQYDQINVLHGIATNGFFVFAPFPFTDAICQFPVRPAGGLPAGQRRFLRAVCVDHDVNMYAQDTYRITSRVSP